MSCCRSSFVFLLALGALVATGPAAIAAAQAPPARAWTGFRGDGASVAAADLPRTWSQDRNVAWRHALEGRGQSSPVLWRGRVFVTAVDGDRKARLLVTAIDLATGRRVWQQTLVPTRRLPIADYVALAAPTPVVDADRVYVVFETGDVAAFDHAGTLRWQRSLMADYGDIRNEFQFGSSPVQDAQKIYLLVAHDGPSYLLALDKATGATRWKTARSAAPGWTTPVVDAARGTIIVGGASGVAAYRRADGALAWEADGPRAGPIDSPTLTGNLLVVPSATRGESRALVLGASGATVRWQVPRVGNDFSSPAVDAAHAYFVNDVGALTAVDLATGAARWTRRLPGPCWASAIVSGPLVYFFGMDGRTTVLRPGAAGAEVVAENVLPVEGNVSGVAAGDGRIVVRTDRALWAIGT